MMQASAQDKRKHVNTCEQSKPSSPKRGETERTSLTLHTAMNLYKLTDSELFWELQLDTRCLMGWNAGVIVLAFRGTASVTNALADLQVGILAVLLLFVFCHVVLLLSFNHPESPLGSYKTQVAQGTRHTFVQAWRVPHLPLRGRTWCCSRPLVHAGFMKSWLAGKFNQKLIHRVMDLVHTCQPGPNKLKIYVTGAMVLFALRCKTIQSTDGRMTYLCDLA